MTRKFIKRQVIVKTKLPKLAEMSNKMFSSLEKRGYKKEKQLKFFFCEYRKATNFGELYFLPKIHKRLHSFTGGSAIFNCGTPTQKCSEFLEKNHLKLLMQRGWSYIKIRLNL